MKVAWPRTAIAWIVWLIAVAFLILWIAVGRNYDLGFFAFFFLFLGIRVREERREKRTR
jgi:hypothetical protein